MTGNKAKHCHQGEERNEYGKCNPVHDVLPLEYLLAPSFLSDRFRSWSCLEIDECGHKCADDYPQELIPKEKWNSSYLRVNAIEERYPQDADERHKQQN